MDAKIKKNVLRKLTYGVYILTTKFNEEYAGATITWVSQASFSPPLLMIGLNKSSNTYKTVLSAKKFILNILSETQKKVAAAFFKPGIYKNGKLNNYEIEHSNAGNPFLKNSVAYIECDLLKCIKGGDHDIIVAEVKFVQNLSDQNVLNLENTGWKYGG